MDSTEVNVEGKEKITEMLRSAQQAQIIDSEQRREAAREEITHKTVEFDRKVKSGVMLFSDHLDLLLHRDSLALVAAQSSSGKSTFCIQVAAHAILNGRKVLVVSNEMDRKAYLAGVARLLCGFRGQQVTEGQFLATVREVVGGGLLRVEDLDTTKGLSGTYDGLPALCLSLIAKHEPEVVLVDQISNANRSKEKEEAKIEGHHKLLHISRSLGIAVNADKYLPPIVMFQQALDGKGKDKKPGSIDMKANLRGAKDTFDDCTHAIYINRVREEGSPDVTQLIVQKQRYFSPYTPVTDWVMDENRILIPLHIALKKAEENELNLQAPEGTHE